MFPYVPRRLEIVPLELKLALMQSPLSRIVGATGSLSAAKAPSWDRECTSVRRKDLS